MKLPDMLVKEIEAVGRNRLAGRIGVSPTTLTNIQQGMPPSTGTLKKLAAYFRVPVASLITDPAGHVNIAETAPAYGPTHRLLELAQRLDPEEVATLERCAQAFTVQDDEVRMHLIGQLKLIERLVKTTVPRKARSDPSKQKAG